MSKCDKYEAAQKWWNEIGRAQFTPYWWTGNSQFVDSVAIAAAYAEYAINQREASR